MSARFEKVQRIVRAQLAKPYGYGKSDCFFLSLAVWDALSGAKRVADYSGRYKTLKGAQRALRREGHESLVGFFSADLEQIAPAMAQMGDLAVLTLDDGNGKAQEHCAVCLGNHFITKQPEGPTRHGLSDVVAAFRVN